MSKIKTSLFPFLIFSLFISLSSAEQCGSQAGGALCPNGLCCSKWGWCGDTEEYCKPPNCQNNCWPDNTPPPPPPGPTPVPPPGPTPVPTSDLSDIITREQFETMLLHRNDSPKCAVGFYSYDAFITAAKSFPGFGTTGNTATRKKEIAAFFGQTSHETAASSDKVQCGKDAEGALCPNGLCCSKWGWCGNTEEYCKPPDCQSNCWVDDILLKSIHRFNGGRPTALDDYTWGYCYKVEQNPPSDYCDHTNTAWPCTPGKSYWGRGPIQLSYNYNYGPCGRDIGIDLLNNPDLVASDVVIAFKSAIWFWMTPQSPKPSCHDVITDQWQPTDADRAAGRLPGYGVITNIINGGLECGIGKDPRVLNRINYYTRYCSIFGVNPGENIDCYKQKSFGTFFLDAAI